MLTPEYLLHVSEGAEEIAARLHTDMLRRVVSRIMARMNDGRDYLLTAADKWRLQVLIEAGYLQDDLTKEIAIAVGREQEEIKQAFEDAGVKAIDYDNKIYEAVGLSPEPLHQSPYMIRLMQRNYEATMHTWYNFTSTTAGAANQAFIETMDTIYNQVMVGGVGYIEAFTEAINSLARTGLIIQYPTGHKDTIETATLRAVRTGVSQASAQIQLARMDEMDVDLVIVSAHMGARPSHQIWQGKIYSRSGKGAKYPDFVASTGYGTGDGLCGWNCRHNFSPYFEGMPNPFERYNDKENVELYEKTQIQRRMERNIRKTKRENEVLLSAAGEADKETAKAINEHRKAVRKKLSRQKDAYYSFCEENNLRPLEERMRIARRSH